MPIAMTLQRRRRIGHLNHLILKARYSRTLDRESKRRPLLSSLRSAGCRPWSKRRGDPTARAGGGWRSSAILLVATGVVVAAGGTRWFARGAAHGDSCANERGSGTDWGGSGQRANGGRRRGRAVGRLIGDAEGILVVDIVGRCRAAHRPRHDRAGSCFVTRIRLIVLLCILELIARSSNLG